MLIAVIISPGLSACSRSGVAPGSRKKSSTATCAFAEMHDRVESDERDREIAGIGGDAGLAARRAPHGCA